MYFNVAQLLKESTGATRAHELTEDISELDEELEALTPLVGKIQMLRTHSGILVTGEVSVGLQITCNRCLGPTVMPIRFKLEESFRPLTEVRTGRYIHPDEFEGEEDNLEDAALLITEQHILDLSEVVRQHIWLSLPMYPTCTTAGLDGCPNKEHNVTGVNPDFKLADDENDGRDSVAEDAASGESIVEEQIDPRWAVLLDLPLNPGDASN